MRLQSVVAESCAGMAAARPHGPPDPARACSWLSSDRATASSASRVAGVTISPTAARREGTAGCGDCVREFEATDRAASVATRLRSEVLPLAPEGEGGGGARSSLRFEDGDALD